MMKPTDSKLVTSSFKGPKDTRKSAIKKSYSPGKFAYSVKGNDEVIEKSTNFDIRFRRKDLRQFDPKHYITSQITKEDVKELKQIFDYYDSTKTGVLLPSDLKLLLSQNGFAPSKETIYEIIAEYDMEEAGGISFHEFMKAMTSHPKDKINHRTMHHVFKKYDRKGKGFITFNDLKEMAKLLDEKDDDEMLHAMIDRAGKTKKQQITYQQFYELMTKTVY